MKNKFLMPLIMMFVGTLLFGTTYSAWVFTDPTNISNTVQVNVPTWTFGDQGFAKIENVNGLSYLTATKEETVTRGSSEAIRFTNTGGKNSKDHVWYINLDKDYNLYDIATYKIEFDCYHTYKREQNTKGFPKLQLYTDNTARGTAQGGDDTITEIAPYVVTNIDEDWWHLEYYITSMCPTIANHQDKPQSNYKINRIKFIDRGVYDYADVTSWFVIDNLLLTNEPGARLGIFNRWASDTAGKWFWFKVAFSGELHSVKLYSSDTSIAVPEFDPTNTVSTSAPFPNGSPFYFRLLSPGTVRFTAVVEVGDNHDVFTITSDNFTVNAA